MKVHYEIDGSARIGPHLLLDQAMVNECLKGIGLETGKFQPGSGYNNQSLQHR